MIGDFMIILMFACFKTDVPPQEEGKVPEIIGEPSDETGSTSGGSGTDSSGGTSGGDSSGGTSGGDSSGGTSGGDSSGGTSGGDSSGGTSGGDSSGGTTGNDVGQICEDSYPIEMITPEGECYSQMISCGDVINGTTSTGTSYYNVDHYNAWQNDPMRGSDYEGLEHAFYMYHPGGENGFDYGRVEVTLETPCSDMDLLYFLTPDGSPTCYNDFSFPSILYSNGASANNGIQDESILIDDNNPNLYYIIVESRSGQAESFRLTVDCQQ